MKSFINDFEQITRDKDNNEVFDETLEMMDDVGEKVVERLDWILENDPKLEWWNDKELMNQFVILYKSCLICLPKNPVERLRWIALLCLEISNNEGFDCSKVITPFDLLPKGLSTIYKDVDNKSKFKSVIDIRNRLKKEGWEAVFPD